jgi:U5 small nuclear ribonucleoprotein component
VEFVLEPLYKLCVNVISKEKEELEPVLASLGVYLKKSDFRIDTKPLLKLVLKRYFGNCSPVIDSIVEYVPNVKKGTEIKVDMYY